MFPLPSSQAMALRCCCRMSSSNKVRISSDFLPNFHSDPLYDELLWAASTAAIWCIAMSYSCCCYMMNCYELLLLYDELLWAVAAAIWWIAMSCCYCYMMSCYKLLLLLLYDELIWAAPAPAIWWIAMSCSCCCYMMNCYELLLLLLYDELLWAAAGIWWIAHCCCYCCMMSCYELLLLLYDAFRWCCYMIITSHLDNRISINNCSSFKCGSCVLHLN